MRDALVSKRISARELTAEFYRRIEQRNRELNAYLALSPERAYEQADRLDGLVARGEVLPELAALPLAVKDVLSTKGVVTTCASRMLEGYRPTFDATTVERMERAGAVVLGKTNCDEFAMGGSNENSAYGPVRNPVAMDRVPGGSSGGSAAAVAAGMAVAALGTEYRRIGASAGLVLRNSCNDANLWKGFTLWADRVFASSLDRVGPFAGSVRDVAKIMAVIAGSDPLDSTAAAAPVPNYLHSLEEPVKGLRIGVPTDYFAKGLDAEVRQRVEAGIVSLERLGGRRVELRMPHTDYAVATYYLIATAEASSNLARYDGVRYGMRIPGGTLIEMYRRTRGAGFGAEVKRRIMLGTYVLFGRVL